MLMNKEDSLLLIIDVQEHLAPAQERPRDVINGCATLLDIAKKLGVPFIVAEQNHNSFGPTMIDLRIVLGENSKFDFSKTNILIVDDINLIKKNKQLSNLEKILDILPADKQNVIYTNRRSKETQSILEKILKAPQEVKVDKNKEKEADISANAAACEQSASAENAAKQEKVTKEKKNSEFKKNLSPLRDKEAVEISKKYNSFNGKTPEFILNKGILADDREACSCNSHQEKVSSPY